VSGRGPAEARNDLFLTCNALGTAAEVGKVDMSEREASKKRSRMFGVCLAELANS
jgi:hypothetical protein